MSARPTLEQLTAEEIPLQALAVDLEGGTMPSCLKLFEHYFKCFGVRNQIVNYYRTGHMPDCSRQIEDAKFCLSVRHLDEEAKRQAWIQRRALWWAHRRQGPSSEDVWETRPYPEDVMQKLSTAKEATSSP